MTGPNKPHEPMSALERLDLGRSYYEDGRFDEAITVWSTITRDDSPKVYALTQLILGTVYADLGKLEQAIEAWSSISHDDDPKTYAQAQLILGTAYAESGKPDQAITAWSKIRREKEIDPKTYAQAQLGLGTAYAESGKPDQAIKTWSSISHDDDPKTYADAQLNLGNTYDDLGKLDEAIKTWSSISHDDDPETYARAQLNLGLAYKNQDELDEAITAWSKIRREKEIDPQTYAQAQLGLGAAYAESGKPDQAITVLSKIRREKEIDPQTYADAQLILGAAYAESGKPDQAIKTWSNINREEADPETYVEAQLGFGEVYSLDKEKEEQAPKAYNNVRDFSYYKSERGFKILNCPLEVREYLHSLAINTDEVLKSLQIIPGFESKVAHYTRPQIAFDLFEDKKNDKEPSNFRLSTIRGVNDPMEGLVLNGYWDQQGIRETIHTNDTATFISCFTFNHDNLNQFRLYGKENGREATGVSLVFNKEFFSEHSGALKYIAGVSSGPSNKSGDNDSGEAGKLESDNKKKLIGKSTLYRCIYLDPETGYWTLAQRDKSTFYRHYKEKAEKKWKTYYKSIPQKEKSVNKHLFAKNKSILSTLHSIFRKYKRYSIKEKQYILEAIRFILLPLQYLVKHIAFQEEQECRIMYITQFRDKKIHSDREEQKMYVEYEESVLPHIDKIWLSPGAAKDQDFFRILLDKGENDNKVRISQNPFRNKE